MTRVQPIVKFEGEHRFLSNFYVRDIKFAKGGLTFGSGEAAFQAAKFRAAKCSEPEIDEYVKKLQGASPQEARNMGRRIPIDLDKWESIKVRCMREIVKRKFDQHEDLRLALIETGAALLVEGNHWGDKFWGRCEGKGLNVLGSILMELRGYYFWKEYQSIW